MARRAAYTLVFIKSDLICRADFGAAPRIGTAEAPRLAALDFWQQPQIAHARLDNSIETALGLGGKCGRTVWVIGEGFWTQTLSLPATALGGLNRDQIAKAIGFDVEALTGLSGIDSALGFCKAAPPDECEHLWVTQVALAARDQIQTAVEAAGGTLGGIVHPGGLPTPLDLKRDVNFEAGQSMETWRRIEVWKDATVCLIGRGNDAQRLAIINGDPAQDAWRANVARWMSSNQAEHCEWLGPRGTMAGESLGSDDSWLALPALKGDALKSWLGRWAMTLCDGARGVPVIEPAKSPALGRRQFAAAALITIACLAGCIVRGTWLAGQRHDQTEARDAAELSIRQLHQLDDKASTLRAELARMRKQPAEPGRARPLEAPDMERQRHRIEGLLAALANCANDNLVIDHIAPGTDGEMLIEGKCLPATAVDGYASKLAAVLPASGWEIAPAQKMTAAGMLPGGPCAFRLRVTPAATPGTSLPGKASPAPALVRGVE